MSASDAAASAQSRLRSNLDYGPDVIKVTTPATAACHCGRPVHVYDEPGMEGFTRDLCLECSTVRCDIAPGACVPREVEPIADV